MFPKTAAMRKQEAPVYKKPAAKVTAEKSKDIMKDLGNELDDIDENDLEQVNGQA